MVQHSIFREIPTWTIVLKVLSMLKLATEFPFTFQKQDIYLENSLEIASILEPYYIPCKARQFLDHTSDQRWITVLRHILLPHGYVLVSQETTRDKKKAIFYTIDRSNSVLKEAIQMDFS